MFVSSRLSPSPPQSSDGDKKQADFSRRKARKAVYFFDAGDSRVIK